MITACSLTTLLPAYKKRFIHSLELNVEIILQTKKLHQDNSTFFSWPVYIRGILCEHIHNG